MLKFNPLFPIISGGGKLQPVYINDLAKCAVPSLTNPAARNQIFEIGGPQQMTLLEIINVIRKIKGYGKRFHPTIPHKPVFGLVKIAEKFAPKMPVTTDQLLMLKEDNTCDNSSIERVFSAKPTSLEKGLSSYWRN
jgi:NADH dehydrogenase